MERTVVFAAGEATEFYDPGDFFRVLDASGSLEVIFYLNGSEVSRAENVSEGYAERFRASGFDRYRIKSEIAQSVQFVARDGADVFYDKPPTGTVSGTVNIGNKDAVNGGFSCASKNVTNASTQIVAENANRRYLMIQNNHATAIVYLNMSGAAATTANSVRLLPGAAVELQGYVPRNAITAIGSIASNTAVIAVEG